MATRTPHCILASLVVLAAATIPLAAQSALRPGDRIRVHSPGAAAPVEGRLVRIDADRLVFRTDGGERSVTRDGTTRIELRNVDTRAGEGAVAGALAGLALGLAVPTGGGDCGTDSFCPRIFSEGQERMMAVGLLALAGTLVGALIGSTIRTEVWEPIGPGAVPPVGPAVPVAPVFVQPAISIGVRLRM